MAKAYRWLLAVSLAIALGACQSTAKPKVTAEDRDKLARVNTELAFQYMQKRDYEIALNRLEKAFDARPNYVDAHNAMGLLRSQLGQFDEAERSFKRALSIESDNPAALNNYGQFLCQRQRHAEGEALFLRAIDNPLYKFPAVALSNAGICQMAAGNLERAETHLRAALEQDPRLAPALLQMADLSFQSQRYLPARAYFQRYAEIARHSPRSLWLGVQIERELGDRDAESSYALQLEKAFPDSPQTQQLYESREQ